MAKSVDWLLGNIDKPNMCDMLGEETLAKLSKRVSTGYDIDCQSRSDWEKTTEAGLKVAKQIAEKKTFPWNDAANIKFPLIATASIQFAARAYPQIINGTDVVRAKVVGTDKDGRKEARAKRVSTHMSWQCLDQMEEWEPGMDQLLHGLPVMGTYFKKTFYDPLLARNSSLALTPFEVVVHMKHKGTLDTCRRISHRIMLYKNEVIEKENAEIYCGDAQTYMAANSDEDNSLQELFVEQHCWFDADGDGYEEPYIVTFHYDSGTVVRVVANYDIGTVKLNEKNKIIKIAAIQYFTKYGFIPSPDGDFYDIGFASLLGPINEAMSTIINQLLDAGALSNTGGGFISKGLRWNGGRLTFELGEWKPVDTTGMSLKDAIMPMPVREPSSVLFQLLGLLTAEGQKLASVNDAMSGEMPSQNTPATTTLAMIEQGLKVFTGIYKRVFRSMKSEFAKLYRLNGMYMEETEYYRILDDEQAVYQTDYLATDMDVVPVADPSMSSEAQRLARANALMQTFETNPDPMARAEILYQYYDAINAKNIDILVNKANVQKMIDNPPPNPDMLKFQLDTQIAKDNNDTRLKELELKEKEMEARVLEIMASIDLKRAQSIKAMADAEAVEPGTQMAQYKTYLEDLKIQQQHDRELLKINQQLEEAAEGAEDGEDGTKPDTEGAPAGMAPEPSNEAGVGGPPIGPPPIAGQPPTGTNLDSALSGTDGNANYLALGQDLRAESNTGNGGL